MAANTLAYGFVGLEHLMNERVTTAGVPLIWDAIQQSAAEHTRQANELMSTFVERTTDAQRRFYLPGTGTLQPLDDYGNPRTVRPGGYYDIAFPIQGGGTAFGDNRVSRALQTVQEVNRAVLDAQARDWDWLKRHILAAVFDSTAWTFSDSLLGNLTIEPLANGDTVTYVKRGGDAATDTHYLATASAISDAANPFPTIWDELMEHPSNRGPVVVYVPTNLTDDVEGLTDFVAITDPDIRQGIGADSLAASLDPAMGDEVMGKCNKCWVVEWKALPDNYMIAHARGAGAVLGMREYDSPELQGFFTEKHSPDGNLNETRMIRYAGFGCQNRVAALVYRFGNADYAVPSGYDAPLAI